LVEAIAKKEALLILSLINSLYFILISLFFLFEKIRLRFTGVLLLAVLHTPLPIPVFPIILPWTPPLPYPNPYNPLIPPFPNPLQFLLNMLAKH
jgi:hypothetical protein